MLIKMDKFQLDALFRDVDMWMMRVVGCLHPNYHLNREGKRHLVWKECMRDVGVHRKAPS